MPERVPRGAPVHRRGVGAGGEEAREAGAGVSPDAARALGERWIKAEGGCAVGALGLWQQDDEEPWPQRVTETNAGPGCGCRLVGADPRDPATLGTWLATVRERYSDPDLHVLPLFRDLACTGRVWVVVSERAEPKRLRVASGATEAEALVAALEARAR